MTHCLRKLLNRTASQKMDMTIKVVIFSMFCLLPTINSSLLAFGITKPQHITNIHWKFGGDFLPSSFQAIKVYKKSIRFKDGVWSKLSRPTLVDMITWEEYTLFLNFYYACLWQRRALQSDCNDCKRLQWKTWEQLWKGFCYYLRIW